MKAAVGASLVLALMLSAGRGAIAAPADHIGVAAAVKDQVHGTVGSVTAPLETGGNVFQDEVVATSSDSMAQLLFLDQTSLSIGPQSEVKLDRFVYDPDKKRGDVVLEASKGAFRFITGAQDPNSYTLKTPVATIGVRGTIVDYGIENGQLIVRLVEGKAIVTLDNGQVIELDEPGEAIIITTDGAVIGPTPWDGEIDTAIKGTSFPLYGDHFEGIDDDKVQDVSYDDSTSLTEELGSHGVRSITDGGTGGGDPGAGGPGDSGGGGGGEDGPPTEDGGHCEHHYEE